MTHVAKRVDRCRLLTLTQLPTRSNGDLDFQAAREQVKDYMRRVRADHKGFELAWAIERNPKDTGFHAHGLQHGSYVPQKVLQERWGGRIVDIRALRRPASGIYTVKEAVKVAGYTVKRGTENFAGLQDHLAINGHRVMHMTRGFLLGRTSRETLQDMSAMLSKGTIESWHREFATPQEISDAF
jgi:predicted secreted Zn-dependent protease